MVATLGKSLNQRDPGGLALSRRSVVFGLTAFAIAPAAAIVNPLTAGAQAQGAPLCPFARSITFIWIRAI